MAINVKEITQRVNSFTYGDRDGEGFTQTIEANATDKFRQTYRKRQNELKEILLHDESTSTELIKTLDSLVGCILEYRYNIVEYGHYTEDKEEQGRCHLTLKN
jgi:hypothetical protein